jgi:flagellar biosynthesis/type III secretory pathway protein FliH
MRKWSPDSFTATIERPAPVFEAWTDRTAHTTGRGDFLNSFENDRDEVAPDPAEEIRRELQDEFNTRAAEMQAEYTRRLTEARAEFTDSLTSWRNHWTDQQERRMRNLAENARDMAVLMAEKIIRKRTDHDRDMLLRTLETALFKIQAESDVTVLVHPDDAFWLEMDEEVRGRLRIGAVVSDRRVDRGGCRIKAGASEWDATVNSQLATLAELLKDALEEPDVPEDPYGGD